MLLIAEGKSEVLAAAELSNTIKLAINDGWEVFGFPMLLAQHGNITKFAQAIVKYGR